MKSIVLHPPFFLRRMSALTAGLMIASLCQSPAVEVANLGGDWINANTLPEGWSFFDSDAPNGGNEIALTPGLPVGNGGNSGFGGGANGSFNLGAVVGDRNGGEDFEIFGDGQINGGVEGTDVLVHPGSPGEAGGGGVTHVILRYTISAADLVHGTTAMISGGFRNLVGGGNSVSGYVYHNANLLFSASGSGPTLAQADGTFNLRALVAENDTIDFVVWTNDSIAADETAIQARIDLSDDELPLFLSVDPGSLSFMATAGGSEVLSFLIQNLGGGVASGEASTEAPFNIVSGGSFNLGQGESQLVEVEFSPEVAGFSNGAVTVGLADGGGINVSLTGVASAPIVPGAGDPALDYESSDGSTAESVVGGIGAGWTYLRSDAANGGNEIPLIQSVNTGDVGGPGFAASNGATRQLPAVVGDNANGGDYELFRDGDLNAPEAGKDLLIHPSTGDGEFVIVRYTVGSGESGSAQISGSFRNLIGATSVDVFVYHNDLELFSASGFGMLSELDATFAVNPTVAPGDTIDFVVGSQGAIAGDETALRASVDIPDGGGLALVITNAGETIDFEWPSRGGKTYDLLSATDLALPLADWEVYNDGVTTYGDLPSSGTGKTTLLGVPPSGEVRFFAIREK